MNINLIQLSFERWNIKAMRPSLRTILSTIVNQFGWIVINSRRESRRAKKNIKCDVTRNFLLQMPSNLFPFDRRTYCARFMWTNRNKWNLLFMQTQKIRILWRCPKNRRLMNSLCTGVGRKTDFISLLERVVHAQPQSIRLIHETTDVRVYAECFFFSSFAVSL